LVYLLFEVQKYFGNTLLNWCELNNTLGYLETLKDTIRCNLKIMIIL
jgi:hypothetical protein